MVTFSVVFNGGLFQLAVLILEEATKFSYLTISIFCFYIFIHLSILHHFMLATYIFCICFCKDEIPSMTPEYLLLIFLD